MSRQELNRMISKDDKGIGDVRGPLSILYRHILFDLGVDGPMIEQQLDRWINDVNSSVKQTSKKRTQARGNYIKKMIDPHMTWKSFADLLMMLYPRYIRLEVKLGWPGLDAAGNPRETTHDITMDTRYLLREGEESSFFVGENVINNYTLDMEGEDLPEEDIYGNPIEGQTQGDFEEDDDDDY